MSGKKINEGVSFEDLDRFAEIIIDIYQLTEEALDIVRESEDSTLIRRAESYWKGHIMHALGKTYSGSTSTSATTMQETLAELKEEAEDYDEDAERDKRLDAVEKTKGIWKDIPEDDDEDMDEKKTLEKKTPVVESKKDLYGTLAEHLTY